MRILSCLVASLFLTVMSFAQQLPIGGWRSYLPYNSARGIATDGNIVYVANDLGFSVYNTLNQQLDAYSKVDGMSDIELQCISYDLATATAVLVYANGNIDLFKNETFYNVPDFKIRTIAGAKNVYDVFTRAGLAYVSTSIGVLVIDVAKAKVKETYEFIENKQVIPVYSFNNVGDFFYAVTNKGIYKAPMSSNELQNFQAWTKIDTASTYRSSVSFGNTLYLISDTVMHRLVNDTAKVVYTSDEIIVSVDADDAQLYLSEYNFATFNGTVRIFNNTPSQINSYLLQSKGINQTLKTNNGTTWMADQFGGLFAILPDGVQSYYIPVGPYNFNSFDIYANNGELWIAHGGFTDSYIPLYNQSGVTQFKDEKWKSYRAGLYRPFDTLSDFSLVVKDKIDGTMYFGSYTNGLFTLKENGDYQLLNTNSIFDPSISIGAGRRQVAGLALDSKRNLWVSTMFSFTQLYAKTADSQWVKFYIPKAQFGGPVLVDDNDQIWMASYPDGGLTVYNPNGTIVDKSDDTYYKFGTGKGFGNLPSNSINCLAKDQNNNIWVGSTNGIGIISNCNAPFTTTTNCDADLPIVQYDQYAGYLFAGNNVRAIAVDGANRKWVGTDDGVWLLSPDAGKIVYRFTIDNSPLPSNRIQKIAIDPITGEVYIGTEQGLVSFRSTATEGGTANSNVLLFPNPVPSDYDGTIAIKGLVANADVRITDINGQLVYRTKALGGQAVWSGKDYTGRRPQSGVYMVFATDNAGNETYTGKLVFLN